MGTVERRERERVELRTKILDAARELFTTEGYDAVTMRKVADKIEYSPTAIYLHFEDKDALIRDLCEHDFQAFAERFLAVAGTADPLERLRKAGHAYFDFATKHPQQYRFMFMTPRPVQEVEAAKRNDPAQNAYVFLRATVEQALAEGLLRPELKDADLVAQTIWAATHGVVALEIVMSCENEWVDWRPFKKRTEMMLDFLIESLSNEPGARSRTRVSQAVRKPPKGRR